MLLRTILLPTDFSECAESALAYAADFARQSGARLVCLHVVEPTVPAVGYGPAVEPSPPADMPGPSEETAAGDLLPRLAGRAECAGLEVEEVLAHGEAAAEIVRAARERGADLIVISAHRRTGLGRILFGSTAESVVRHAHCPVLVVKPKGSGE
jgi:nucleotide-binding universal stress UspA family protein